MPRIHVRKSAHVAASRQAVLDADATLATLQDGSALTVTVTENSAGSTVEVAADVEVNVPYFAWFVTPLARSTIRREVAGALENLCARAEGRPPVPPRRHSLAPPVPFSTGQSAHLTTVAVCTAMVAFGASLASQHVHFIARSFHASDASLGVALAASRVGILIGFVASALADRKGRRRLLLLSLLGVCAGNAIAALAPNLAVFAGGQVLVRGFANSAFAVSAIMAIEEAPSGARAFTVSMLSLAGALGYGMGTVMLPLGDVWPHAWRGAFALSAASAVLLPGVARNLGETGRYTALAARTQHRGSFREVLGRSYGRRFSLLVATAFLGSVFGAPGSQFQNRYLGEQRGFSGLQILIFLAVTGTPGFLGLILGGRLAETYGRRPVATITLLLATLAQMAFFVTSGPAMWVISVASSVLGGMLAPVLGALGIELFATEIRGTANGLLLVAGVCGAAIGLAGAGLLASAVGGLGPAIALMGVAALLSVPLIPRLPEAAWRSLEEVSPSEV